ncbi:hypothetical protein H17ap60334_00350 [Thermosipho africanus H17ap60334]|uniref:Uncharacterized protein n=1 Tax=Thermosipho africanus (strain TCF52B) TaxID=484019 RepID=B7IGR4_THEAB|nr:hypothetical protein [Thermosipho africanus]ACJ75278.1 hypothetical protein THA_816 [Thermosipho africanus TCF52B]EKF50344.1 hypothetical protein H17ap60334_00350 [Thermosipho africanus H17ap60334]MDK2885964.1 hypothetical protein [Thermosipho sp. (in: thermotogales)]
MKLISNVFFISAVIFLAGSLIFFEIGMRAMRKKIEEKEKKSTKIAIKLLIVSGILFGISGVLAFFA